MNAAVICYLPPPRPQTNGFLRHFMSVKTALPVIFCSNHKWGVPNLVHVELPKPNLEYKVKLRDSDSLGAQIFCNCIKVAAARGITDMLYVEDDCFLTMSHWDQYILDEYRQYPKALCGGTPVIFNLVHGGQGWLASCIEYMHDYQVRARIPAALEGCQPRDDWRYTATPHIFPNGALAIYNVAMLQQAFAAPLEDFESHRHEALCFDQVVGIYLTKKYGYNVFEKCAALSSVYSGCGDHYLTADDRKELVRSVKKAGVHKWSFV